MTNQTELTRAQRLGAAWRAATSFGTAFGAIIAAAVAGLINPSLIYAAAIGWYVFMIYSAWSTGEFRGRKQIDGTHHESKQDELDRTKKEQGN